MSLHDLDRPLPALPSVVRGPVNNVSITSIKSAHRPERRRTTIVPRNAEAEAGAIATAAAVYDTAEDRSIAAETRDFARKQLRDFRGSEEKRVTAYRQLRAGLRNIDAIIQDIPITDQLTLDVREKMPSQEVVHLKNANTALHRKVLDLTELLEICLKSEASMRRRMELAEERAEAAENRVIDLQSKLFEAELANMGGPVRLGRSARGTK